MKIITEPNSILHAKCRKVAKFDMHLTKIADNMVKTLDNNAGIGLAAPQIGQTIRLIVIEFNPKKLEKGKKEKSTSEKVLPIPRMILANPKITSFSREKNIAEEGCLSLPGIELKITRSNKVNVLAYNLGGERIKIRAKGLLSRVLQHEIDHLDGILITDRKIK